MMSTSMPKLPIELHDLILDFCLPSHHSLTPLTLVCHHWRTHLHTHTFRTLHLTSLSLRPFSLLLSSPFTLSCLFRCVKHLAIHIKGAKAGGGCALIFALNHVLDLLSCSPYLDSLTLARATEKDIITGLQSITPHRFPYVRTLRLYHIMFLDPAGFVDLFRSVPRVRSVEFEGVFVNWRVEEDVEPVLPRGRFALGLVIFNVSSKRTRIKWDVDVDVGSDVVGDGSGDTDGGILGGGVMTDSDAYWKDPDIDNDTLTTNPNSKPKLPHISEQDLYCLSWLLRADIAPLLRTIGPALRELDIDLQLGQLDGTSLSAIEKALDLSHTPSLHHLSIGSSKHVLSFIHWVPRVLFRLPKNNTGSLNTNTNTHAPSTTHTSSSSSSNSNAYTSPAANAGAYNTPSALNSSAYTHPTSSNSTSSIRLLEIRFASSRHFHLDKPFLRWIKPILGCAMMRNASSESASSSSSSWSLGSEMMHDWDKPIPHTSRDGSQCTNTNTNTTQGLTPSQTPAETQHKANVHQIRFVAYHDEDLDDEIERAVRDGIRDELGMFCERGVVCLRFCVREKRRGVSLGG